MKLKSLVLTMLLSLWFSHLALADTTQYTEKVEVFSRSPAEKNVYLATGLNQLVNKITNNPSAFQKAEVVKAQANVLEYVLRYQYVSEVDPFNPQENKLFLKVEFDPRAVQKLLRQAKLTLPESTATAETKEHALLEQEEKIELAAQNNALTVIVDNVDETTDYKEVINYLSAFDAISKIQVVELSPPQVTFDVVVKGGAEHLQKLILLDNVLVPEVNTHFPREVSEAPQPLKYKYQR